MTAFCAVLNKSFDIFRCQLDQAWDGLPVYALSSIPVINSLFLEYKARQVRDLLSTPTLPQQIVNLTKFEAFVCHAGLSMIIGICITALVAVNVFSGFALGSCLVILLLSFIHGLIEGREMVQLCMLARTPTSPMTVHSLCIELSYLLFEGLRKKEIQLPLHNLHDLVRQGKIRITQQKIESGTTDINLRDHLGRTPLHYASSLEIIQYLVRMGAEVNATDSEGKTILHFQDQLSTAEVDFLVNQGANVDATDHEGNTPSHTRPNYSRYHLFFRNMMLSALINRGANLQIANHRGVTAESTIVQINLPFIGAHEQHTQIMENTSFHIFQLMTPIAQRHLSKCAG